MSSDVNIGDDQNLINDSPVHSPKHVSKSLQNIRSDCIESKPPKKNEQHERHHRRTQSHTLTTSIIGLQRSLSHQPAGDTLYENKVNGDVAWRLLVVSSKVRNTSSIRHALLQSSIFVQFNFDSHALDDLNAQISQALCGRKINGAAFILSCSGSALQLVAKEERIINKDGGLDSVMQEFFFRLVQNYFITADTANRIDFLAWHGLQYSDITPPLVTELQNLTGVSVGIWRDLTGYGNYVNKGEETSRFCIGDLYFRVDKLRNWSGRHQQSLAGFEKIRTVGKGAYGAAVLYKKKDDESLVILKEINMHDLNASERQMALNEVSVLAMLDHPNIISYYDSFEEDGVLMIEMEYADNGTLAQFLSKQDRPLDEKDILTMFQQIVAAIRHVHSHNTLHRDLKTDNIFLTKEGVIKIGDFGISKIMGSANKGAQTVLGTPYYISPEMCEGKEYSFKSDIWALGCILYEIACLQKTFEGSNLPALVNKIMRGQFAPVKGNYSDAFKDLVENMLRKDPADRPEANTIMYHLLPKLMNKYGGGRSDQDDEINLSENFGGKGKVRSVIYYLETPATILTCINDLPSRMKVKNMSVGPDHVVLTTVERQVFSWGLGCHGQLGHGDTKDRYIPVLIEALKGKSVTLVCCGSGFSIFGSDNGLVLTCGDGTAGSLGHGDWNSVTRPRLIESLLSVDVTAMACGMSHVAVIGRDGVVLTWGDNCCGQLGLGSEESQCVPTIVQISEPVIFTDVQCGKDGTMLLSDVGSVFACGNNENNKLGLNNRQGFLMAMKNIFTKTEVDGRNVPTPVRALARHRVVAISMGTNHSAVIVEPGHVITFGRNTVGQLGTQNTKSSSAPVEVKALEDKCVNHVQCGDHYTIASTKDQELFYWGLRYTVPFSPRYEDTTSQSSANDSGTIMKWSLHTEPYRVESLHQLSNSNGSTNGDKIEKENSVFKRNEIDTCNESAEISTTSENDKQGFRPLSSVPKRSCSASSHDNSKDKDRDKDKEKENMKDDSVIIFNPTELIKVVPVQSHEKMMLGNIYCHGENLFIQVETTAPPPRRRTFKKKIVRHKSNQSFNADVSSTTCNQGVASSKMNKVENSCSSETSEMDTQSSIPTWLKDELAQSTYNVNDGNEADDTSGQSDQERLTDRIDSSMSSIQVNRGMTPVSGNPNLTTSQTFISGTKCSPRNSVFLTQSRTRIDSVNSSESNVEAVPAEMSDSSSGDRVISAKIPSKQRPVPAERQKFAGPKERTTKHSQTNKQKGKGRGRGHTLFISKQIASRGLISDVTVKRREEALLFELERLKQEKKEAEARIRLLEQDRENQKEVLKQESRRLAKEREKALLMEVDKMRNEIETQDILLKDKQRIVGELQQKLELVTCDNQQFDSCSFPRTPRNPAEGDDSASDQQTPRAESSSSSSSKRSNSRMCLIQ